MLKSARFKVWGVAPGLLATGQCGDPAILKKLGAADPRLGREAITGVVEGKRDADTGKSMRKYGQTNVQAW